MPNNTTTSFIMIHNDKPIGFLLSVTAQSDIQLSATAKAKVNFNKRTQSNEPINSKHRKPRVSRSQLGLLLRLI